LISICLIFILDFHRYIFFFFDIDYLTILVARQSNIEPAIQDQTKITLNLFNTILETTNTHFELNHSWAAIERDISAQEKLEARCRQPRNQQ
jgi:hypothetical protein